MCTQKLLPLEPDQQLGYALEEFTFEDFHKNKEVMRELLNQQLVPTFKFCEPLSIFSGEVVANVVDYTTNTQSIISIIKPVECVPEIDSLVRDRDRARANKDYKTADRIRELLATTCHVNVRDHKDGPSTWSWTHPIYKAWYNMRRNFDIP